MSRRRLGTLIALVLAIGLFTAASAPGSAAGTLIEDKFNEKNVTDLELHSPNAHPAGSAWDVKLGTFEVKKGAFETSSTWWGDSSDYRAIIDSQNTDVSTELELKVGDDTDQFWGVVARYSSETDWIMAFHDGVGDLVLGKATTNEDEGGNPAAYTGFQEMGRFAIEMGPQKKAHKIKIEAIGSTISVFANGVLVLTREDTDHVVSTEVGIFSRGAGNNQFYKFKVMLIDGGSGGGGPLSSPLGGGEPDDDDDDDKGKKDKKDPKGKKDPKPRRVRSRI